MEASTDTDTRSCFLPASELYDQFSPKNHCLSLQCCIYGGEFEIRNSNPTFIVFEQFTDKISYSYERKLNFWIFRVCFVVATNLRVIVVFLTLFLSASLSLRFSLNAMQFSDFHNRWIEENAWALSEQFGIVGITIWIMLWIFTKSAGDKKLSQHIVCEWMWRCKLGKWFSPINSRE